MRCNQCDSLYINGVFCHETGCPNTHKVYDKEEKQWVTPEPEQEEDEDEHYCPKCGEHFFSHNDDGSCVNDEEEFCQDENRGGTGHGDISYSDADLGL